MKVPPPRNIALAREMAEAGYGREDLWVKAGIGEAEARALVSRLNPSERRKRAELFADHARRAEG